MNQIDLNDRATDHASVQAPSRDAERWSQTFTVAPDDDPSLARSVRMLARHDSELSSSLYTMRPADQSLQLVLVADAETALDHLEVRLRELVASERPEVAIRPLRRRRTS